MYFDLRFKSVPANPNVLSKLACLPGLLGSINVLGYVFAFPISGTWWLTSFKGFLFYLREARVPWVRIMRGIEPGFSSIDHYNGRIMWRTLQYQNMCIQHKRKLCWVHSPIFYSYFSWRSATVISLIRNFCTLPVTVFGKSSRKSQNFGILKYANWNHQRMLG